MICHTVRNGGCIFLILYFWIYIGNSEITKTVSTVQEFCSGNLYIHNIEPGAIYQLTLKSEVVSSGVNKLFKSKRQCRKRFKTSDPASHFLVLISNMTIPACNSNCLCNFFEISVEGQKHLYCGSVETDYFTSKSEEIFIYFSPGINLQFDVTLTFSVERNFYVVNGRSSKHNFDGDKFIETPYFPNQYSPNYRADYLLQSDEKNSNVVLLFLDFQISNQSFIEVVGNNGTHPTRFYGSTFRPPAIVSQSGFLDVKFTSNQVRMAGFRALCSFIKNVDSLSVPYTDCGGPKDGLVGHMSIKTHKTFGLYDCVWHINAIWAFSIFPKWYMSVSVQMKDIGHKSLLEFRDGHNSKAKIVKAIDCEVDNCSSLHAETIVPASSHLYIRFHGYLDNVSVLNMSYSIFHTQNCSDDEFVCDNGRCLPFDLQCDGIKQCPNGMDEEQCPITADPVAKVPAHPSVKKEAIFDNTVYSKFLIIIIVGSIGLVAVIAAVSIYVWKYKFVHTNIEQADSQVIGEMSDMAPTLYPDNLYGNDSPPSYEDFVKSSDCYPPLLYTRAKQFIPKDTCTDCNTSFSTGTRPRYHSANSFSFQGSKTDRDIFAQNSRNTSQQASSNCCSIEIFNSGNRTTDMRKWYSLDSKLDDLAKQDTCHLFLSIIHPVCNHGLNHPTHVQCHSLPPNFKISNTRNEDKSVKLNAAVSSPTASSSSTKDRSCSCTFVPRSSEILTVLKTRCCSEPCKGISVHYSLY